MSVVKEKNPRKKDYRWTKGYNSTYALLPNVDLYPFYYRPLNYTDEYQSYNTRRDYNQKEVTCN